AMSRVATLRAGRGLCLAAGAWIAALLLATPAAAEPARPPHAASTRDPGAQVDKAEKEDRIQRAKALHDDALALYDRGKYRAALEKLKAAVALDPDGKELVYNLALIHERLGELELAGGFYRRYLEMETDPKLRERAEGILKRIEGAKKD